MLSFRQLFDDINRYLLSFLNFNDLLRIAQVEKYLFQLLSQQWTWVYLLKIRNCNQIESPISLYQLKTKYWRTFQYCVNIIRKNNEISIYNRDINFIKGCLFACYYFNVRGYYDTEYHLIFPRQQLIDENIMPMIQGHIINCEFDMYYNILIYDKIKSFLTNGHTITKIQTAPSFEGKLVYWLHEPGYVVDADKNFQEGIIKVLTYLGLSNIELVKMILDPSNRVITS